MPTTATAVRPTSAAVLAEEFRHFRAAHPPTRQTFHGQDWEWICAGSGEESIVLLPGALGAADSAMGTIRAMAQEVRLIAVSYPPVPTMAALTEGIAEIMTKNGLESAHIFGGSYGGMVAQVFAQRYPGRVKSLILSHTGGPDKQMGARLRPALRVMSILPAGVLRWAMRAKVAKMFRGTGQAEFWREYVQEQMAPRTKADILAIYERVHDFCQNHPAMPGDPAPCGAPVLIMESDRDEMLSPSQRAALRSLYPSAEVHTFHNAGHLVTLTRREEYVGRILDFVLRRPVGSKA
ncbi:MAG: alpha/beta hydrolase [Acidobacteriales bacterium]|nr:alpha/beta hydrolase [Terriglobales bacterium]